MPRPRRLALTALEDRSVPAALSFDAGTAALVYTAAPGVANTLTVSFAAGEYTFADPAEPLALDPSLPAGAVADNPNTVRVPAAAVGGLVIQTGDGNDTITLRTADEPVDIDAGAGSNTVVLGGAVSGARGLSGGAVTVASTGGTAALTIDNRNDTTGRAVLVDEGVVTGLAPSDVTYAPGEVNSVTLLGGAGVNGFTVVGAAAGTTTAITAGPGADTVSVLAAVGSVVVNGGGGADTVRLGDAGSLQGILGAVSVGGPAGSVALSIDNSGDPTGRTAALGAGGLTGLAPGAISFAGGLASLSVAGGPGGNTFAVTGTPTGAATILTAGTGSDAVSVSGTGGALDLRGAGGADQYTLGPAVGLAGAISLGNPAGTFALTLDDTGGVAGRSITFSNTAVGGFVPGGLTLAGGPVALVLRGGDGADTFTPAGPVTIPTQLFGGGGADRYVVPPGVAPNATFDGGPGADTVDFSAFSLGVTVNLAAGSANGIAIAGVENATGGAGDDFFTGDGNANVFAGGAGSNIFAGGAGDDTYVLSPAGGSTNTVTDVGGADTLSFAGAAGGVALDLDTSGVQTLDAAGNRLILTGQFENFVGGPGADDVTFGPLAGRQIDGGGGADVSHFNNAGLPFTVVPGGIMVEGIGFVAVALPGGGAILTGPQAAGDSYRTTASRALTVAAPGVLGNDTFRAGTGVTASLDSGPAHGTVTVNADGSFTYTPAGGFLGTDSFVYRAGDGTNSTAATVTVAVGRVLTDVYAVGAGVGGGVTLYNRDGSVRTTVDAFASSPGGVRTAAADFNGDGIADVAAGTGPGSTARVRVLDGATGAELFAAAVFEGFAGGVFVAAGDLDGDGRAELVVTPDEGGGPRVLVFRGTDFAQTASFFGIDDPAFRGGARAAIGDVNGDGRADLIVAAGFGGGPRVAVFDGTTIGGSPRKLVNDFFVFEPGLRDGVNLAVGDVDGDGFGDLIAGAGPGGGPRVLTLSGRLLMGPGAADALAAPVTNFFAGDPANRSGVRVAAKDLDGDAKADLVTGAAAGGRVTAYAGKDFSGGGAPELTGIDPFAGFAGGVFVG